MLLTVKSWNQSPLNKSVVIPGNPREGGGRLGIQEIKILLDTRFRGYALWKAPAQFAHFNFTTLAWRPKYVRTGHAVN
jgi:hypothetical protein